MIYEKFIFSYCEIENTSFSADVDECVSWFVGYVCPKKCSIFYGVKYVRLEKEKFKHKITFYL